MSSLFPLKNKRGSEPKANCLDSPDLLIVPRHNLKLGKQGQPPPQNWASPTRSSDVPQTQMPYHLSQEYLKLWGQWQQQLLLLTSRESQFCLTQIPVLPSLTGFLGSGLSSELWEWVHAPAMAACGCVLWGQKDGQHRLREITCPGRDGSTHFPSL